MMTNTPPETLLLAGADPAACQAAYDKHRRQPRQVASWSSPAAWQEVASGNYWFYGVIPHMNQGCEKSVIVWLDDYDVSRLFSREID